MKTRYIFSILLLASCSGNAPSSPEKDPEPIATEPKKEETRPMDNAIETPSADWETAQFVLKKLGEDKMGVPHTLVNLNVGGKNIFIDSVTACSAIPANNFKQYDIPKDAIGACGGWWAGGGDYFYAVVQGKRLEIYQGWQEESEQPTGYHWKKVKVLK